MLPRKNRLKKKKDFERIFKKGKEYKEDFLLLKTISNNLQFSRFGFIINKKVVKKATIRNKIKRRLREVVRREILPKIKKRVDCVIIVKPGIKSENFSFEKIKNTLYKLTKKAKLLEDD